MKCPKCRTATLESLVVDEVEVDRCSTCDGLWFDRGELGNLLDSKEELLAPLLKGEDEADHDHVHGACPRHRVALMKVLSLRNKEVAVETCPVCQGIWLDGGEFRRIRTHMPHLRLGDLV
jgi:Zn-finger nucleic acid-binding protein